MSLLDGLIEDALLETVVRAVVHVALRTDSASTRGHGTAENPYDGSKVGAEYRLDTILRSLPASTTVVLGPGIFLTRGFKNSGSDGWAPKSGLRIVGSGWGTSSGQNGPTILKLEGHAVGPNVAVGCGTVAGEELSGFEICDLAIDCALPGGAASGVTAKAIDVTGTNILVHDLQIINFGAVGATTSIVTIARPSVTQPDAYNCVISDVVLETPASNSVGVTCIQITTVPNGSTAYYHRSCVIRNNLINGGLTTDFTKNFVGISAPGGLGTFVELNRIWNCKRGFSIDLKPAKDLLIRENHLYNCLEGCVIDLDDADPWTIGRVLLQENIIELPTGGGLSPVGIRLDGDAAAARLFKQVVIRNNQIRHLDAAAGAAATIGISLDSTEAAIVEENLINIGTSPNTPDISKAIQRTSSVAIKTFNNQSTHGKFLPSTFGSPMRQDPDMITEAENWLLTT